MVNMVLTKNRTEKHDINQGNMLVLTPSLAFSLTATMIGLGNSLRKSFNLEVVDQNGS